MSGSSPDLEAIIEAGRRDAAPAEKKARIKSSVLARVGVSVLAAGAGTFASSGAAASGIISSKVVLYVASVLVAGGVATGAIAYAHRDRSPAIATTSAATVPERPRTSPPTRMVEPPASVPSPAPPEPAASAPRIPDTARSGAAPTASTPGSLEQEVALLRDANAALAAGDPGRALKLAGEHAKQFPRGALAEERRAIIAIAQCRAHPGEASLTRARGFMRGSPSSPLVDRVRAACSK